MKNLRERHLISSQVKRQRTYFGEDMAKPLVGWLNKRRKSTDEAKIVQLLERIQKFTRSAVPILDSSIWLIGTGRIEFHGRKFISPAQMARWRKTGRLPIQTWGKIDPKEIPKFIAAGPLPPDPELVRINKELRRYMVHPSLLFQVEDRWSVGFKPFSKGSELVSRFIRLAETGLLLRVRRCRKCEQWFFARYYHQAFCSHKCRQKNFRESEKGKLQRREYMREYMRERYRNSK